MKTALFTTAALMVLFSFAGCAFMGRPLPVEPRCFDLGALNEKAVEAPAVEFRSFTDISGNGLRIPRRSAEGTITFEENCRFSAPPAQLIRRRLTELFPVTAATEAVRVSAVLSRFEIDSASNSARVLIDYRFSCGEQMKGVRHDITCKIGSGRNAAAGAMEKCVITSARRLGQEISSFYKSCEKEKVKK